MKISLFIHVIGIVMWVGSLIVIPSFMRGIQVGADPGSYIVRSTRRGMFGYLIPGLVLAVLSGLYQFGTNPSGYLQQGWFHGKVLFLIALLSASVLLFIEFKKLSAGSELSKKNVIIVQAIASVSLIAISFFTMVLR